MKKLLIAIGLIASLSAFSQTTNSQNPVVEIGQGIAALGSSTNWGFVGYGTLGSKTKNGTAYGGGLLGIYSLNNFMGLGGGVDELTGLDSKGQATIVSANLQVQLPLKPFASITTNSSFLQNFTITPFLYSGLGTPIGSTIGQSAVSHEGEGLNIDFVKVGGLRLGAGFAYIQRQNAGVYSGNYKNFFIALHHPF